MLSLIARVVKQARRPRLATLALLGAVAAAPLLAAASGPLSHHAAQVANADNWVNYGRTYDETHFSPLTQINDKTIGRLKLAWSTDIDVTPTVFSAPLAVDGVLYYSTGYSVIHATDAQTGKPLWTYDPEVGKHAGRKLRALWGVRGIAFKDGKVFTGTVDGRLLAINARTGKLLWSTLTVKRDDALVITGPPTVFKDKVVIGNAGAEYGPVRGYVAAYDINTGKQVWRFYTVPGDPAKGPDHAASDSVMAMAAKTWKGKWWRFGGGGNAWQGISYDPKFNRVYFGTANGVPWNQNIRSPGGGDNLFLAAIVAVDADTGRYVWHYQETPGEKWDFDATADMELADMVIDGKTTPVLLQAPKNGFFYVIDRRTGKVVSAEKIAKATWADRIDLKTGRPVDNPEAQYHDKPVLVFPGAVGSHSVQAMSYSPLTGLVYVPTTDFGRGYFDEPGDLAAWAPKPGMGVITGTGSPPPSVASPPPLTNLVAWDPVKQQAAWRITAPGVTQGGTLATAGNLVFQGRSNGELVAYAADTGQKLWSFDAQVGILAQPITYSVGGKQYVTVLAGWRATAPNGDGTLWDYRTQHRRLLTFVLDGTATLPAPDPAEKTPAPFLDDPAFKADPAKVKHGLDVFMDHCMICHGPGAIAGGAAPDLRRSPIPLSLDALTAVVKGGALQQRGMPRFEEFTKADLEGLQQFIRSRARTALQAASK